MTLLSAILPGIRTVRTPLTAGFLWILAIAVYAFNRRAHISINQHAIKVANALLPGWFGIVVIPVVILAAYLLGSIMTSLTAPPTVALVRLYTRLLTALQKPPSPGASDRLSSFRRKWNRRAWAMMKRSEPISLNARGFIIDYIMATLTTAGATGSAAMMFPVDLVIDGLTQNSAQLSQAAPDQYQEYDRIRTESEFRISVVPPLLVVACLLPVGHRWVFVVLAVIACAVLLAQSVELGRKANDILAAAARIGYVGILQIQSLAEFLSSLQDKPESDGAWMGAIAMGLSRRGFFEEADAILREFTELNQDEDVFEIDEYLRKHDSETAFNFRRVVERMTPGRLSWRE